MKYCVPYYKTFKYMEEVDEVIIPYVKEDINFIKRDFWDFKHEYLFDEIITEMPRLDRGEADDFYGRFFEKSGELLKKDGIMIIYSTEKGILKKYIRLHKEFTIVSEVLMDTKDDGNIYIIKKLDWKEIQ